MKVKIAYVPQPLKSTSSIVMFSTDKYLDQHRDTEPKRTNIHFINEFKKFKEYKKLNEHKKNKFQETKCLSGAQESTNMKLNEMIRQFKI